MSERSVRVELIGAARIVRSEAEQLLERKAAGLLAYLALSGPTPRTRIAGLLWPESRERTARNNLAQAIRRLRGAADGGLIEGDTAIAIARDVDVDVVLLEVLVQRGRYGEAVVRRGTLLDGHDYDDCSELESWLAGQRERVRRTLRRASAAEAERLEREGDLGGALDLTAADLGADALDEDAHRRKMRLLYLRGDAAGALRAFEQCKALLDAELGAPPHPDTTGLAAEIRKGSGALQSGRPRARRHPPLAVPAPLTGRAGVWDRLEEAWLRQRGIVLVGDAGVGKTRLMVEFAATKGSLTLLEGRPGDVTVPYATQARTYRQMLDRFPATLPDWVRHELARIVPDLGQSAPASQSPFDKVRFLEAMVHATQLAVGRGMTVLCFDDLQFVDPASLEASLYVLSKFWSGELPGLRTLFGVRRGEMSADLEARLRTAADAGLVEMIPVEPLGSSDVQALLAKLEPTLAARATEITRVTGGIPFFVLELVETFRNGGTEGGDVDTALARGTRARELVRLRIEALSPGALRLARLCAVAGTEFDVRLAADVLEVPVVDLSDPLDELEQASVFQGRRFVHDLLHETVAEGIPEAVKTYVHERVARHLAARAAEPARVAHHFLRGGCDAEAAPLLRQAATRAKGLSRMADAADLLDQAARIYESIGERSRAFDALAESCRFMSAVDVGDRFTALVESTARLASTDGERARHLVGKGFMDFARGHLAEAERAAIEAITLADRAAEALALVEAWQIRLRVQMRRNRPAEAARALDEFDRLARELGDPEGVLTVEMHRGELLALEDRHEEAIAVYRRATVALLRWGELLYAEGEFLALIARSQMILGRAREAERTLATALPHVETLSSSASPRSRVRLVQAECDVALERYAAATTVLDEISRATAAAATVGGAALARAAILVAVRRPDEALAALGELGSDERTLPGVRAEAILTAARLRSAPSEDDVRFVVEHGTPLQRARLELRRSHASAREGLEAAQRALAAIESLGALGHFAEAHARIAEHQAALGDTGAAVASADRAVESLAELAPIWFSVGEVLATRAGVLARADHPEAAAAAEAAAAWLRRARAAIPEPRIPSL